jgi:hypothetical protein
MRDPAADPVLPADEINGDISVEVLKRVERLIFLGITDPGRFKPFVATCGHTTQA